ncbi:ABC transporter ATP-binding protein [uncultured Microbacterium sp.]|uniref:ABC transporter ATP-binding protein n=1 Tax=uncultured Microbacterium sp. TaxID=191216 RepID=UPI0028D212EB|nr:ABC transporter ATP-binding protein [uncultured Microbacterium sp.]
MTLEIDDLDVARDDPPAADLRRLFRVRRRDFLVVGLLGVVQAALLVDFILIARLVIDQLVPQGVGDAAEAAYQQALWFCMLLGASAVLVGIARSWEFTWAERAGYKVVRALRLEMYAHLQRMRPEHLRHRARGGLLLRLTGDLSMLRMWLSRGLLEGLSAAIVLVVALGVLTALDVWLALAVVSVLASGAAVSLCLGRPMRDATRSMRRRRSSLMSNIDEQITAIRVSQVSGRVRGEFRRLSRQNDALNVSLLRVAGLRGALRGISAATSLVSVVGVLAVGLVQVHRGASSVGAVVVAALLTRYLARPVRTLGLAHDYWHRGLVSRQKVVDFLRSSSRGVEDEQLTPLEVRGGRIEFIGVTVPGALDGFTAVADRGEFVAITGPSGSGKTAVLDVLTRMVEPASGTVAVDGQVLSETSPSSVGAMMGVAGPDLPLLRGTVLRNLTYADRRVGPGEVQRVVRSLGLDDVLRRHDDRGVMGWIMEGGANLTIGDRQLLALARAMMGTPRILLLDEPLAGMDAEARSRAREAILRHRGTVLMITQDPDALSLADSVWVMSEDGTAETLTGEEYRAHLWRNRNSRSRRWTAAG